MARPAKKNLFGWLTKQRVTYQRDVAGERAELQKRAREKKAAEAKRARELKRDAAQLRRELLEEMKDDGYRAGQDDRRRGVKKLVPYRLELMTSPRYEKAFGKQKAQDVLRRSYMQGQKNPSKNPAVSAAQYRLAQAVLSGRGARTGGMSRKVAQELVDRTPAAKRSQFMKGGGANPSPGYKAYQTQTLKDLLDNPFPQQVGAGEKKKIAAELLRRGKLGAASAAFYAKGATAAAARVKANPGLYDSIKPGSRVTIINRFGQRTGRAVMLGPAGWVLNMGGKHGTPDIASPANVVKVTGGKAAATLGHISLVGRNKRKSANESDPKGLGYNNGFTRAQQDRETQSVGLTPPNADDNLKFDVDKLVTYWGYTSAKVAQFKEAYQKGYRDGWHKWKAGGKGKRRNPPAGGGAPWLVQYKILNKSYSVGFSTRAAAEKAVEALAKHGRQAVIVERKGSAANSAGKGKCNAGGSGVKGVSIRKGKLGYTVYFLPNNAGGFAFGNAGPFETKKAAQEYIRRRRADRYKETSSKNGRRNPEADAAALSAKFHGRPASTRRIVEETEHQHKYLMELGPLVRLVLDTVTGFVTVLNFNTEDPRKMVILACSERDPQTKELVGKQLYLKGGDQEVNLKALGMNSSLWIRDSMELGRLHGFKRGERLIVDAAGKMREAQPGERAAAGEQEIRGSITYQTRKGFDDFELIDYWHKAGEETERRYGQAARPLVIYDYRNKRLKLAGGQYRIDEPGIIN